MKVEFIKHDESFVVAFYTDPAGNFAQGIEQNIKDFLGRDNHEYKYFDERTPTREQEIEYHERMLKELRMNKD